MVLMNNDFGPPRRRHDKFNTAAGRVITPNEPPKQPSESLAPPAAPGQPGDTPTLDTSSLHNQPAAPKKRFHLTKKQWIIVGLVALGLLIAGLGWWAWQANHSSGSSVSVVKGKKTTPPPPTTVASTLTGRQVAPATNQVPTTAVMIENSPDARPQSGLEHAGVVFEAVAEGGITRFLAIFQDTAPDYIGPIRSVRPYYIDWLHGFDAAVAHVGGSPAALAKIKAENIKDLDQFANSGAYTRIPSRYAPHNVYSSLGSLQALEAKKGYGAPQYTGFERKPDAPSQQITARAIDFNISAALYNAHFDYDPVHNDYLRSQAGGLHLQIDKAGAQAQIRPHVVVALIMAKGMADDQHTAYGTIGSGPMFVFQDGVMQQGTWTKTSGSAQFVFTDAANKPLKLNAGQTWFTVLGAVNGVAYRATP